ncbi:MAG: glycosyltransferase family 2 protein, partial [Nitrospiraceae bacterium]
MPSVLPAGDGGSVATLLMRLETIILAIQWLFLLYFVGLFGGYLTLNLLSFVYLRRYVEERSLGSLPQRYSGYEPQISIIVPAYNESATIAASVRSLLQLSYSEYEIVVINDGSKDQTLDVLMKEFGLVPFPEAYDHRLPTMTIRATYYSTIHTNLRVIDKE